MVVLGSLMLILENMSAVYTSSSPHFNSFLFFSFLAFFKIEKVPKPSSTLVIGTDTYLILILTGFGRVLFRLEWIIRDYRDIR